MSRAIDHPLSIAIVGMSLRVPGAQTVQAFWNNLREGVESIEFFEPEDLESDAVLNKGREGFVGAGAVLDDVDRFDAEFFGISAREASFTDPQQRFFLECCHEALEDAACDPERTEDLIGVYAGAGISSYLIENIVPNHSDFLKTPQRSEIVLANDKDFLATRVAYRLDLKGPAVTVQTACSTSLTAVHSACQGLLGYQCDLALAGGVTILLPQKTGYHAQEGGVFSPDGHCRAFDAGAAGTIFGSGVGVVALKRLADAIETQDPIYAVIRGIASNNDGAQKVGFTAPSVAGQAEVLAAALAVADVEASSIDYVEAHGTGTQLGDPIEVAALNLAYGESCRGDDRCAIGSVKTNVGHLDAASGVVGLIKTALSLHHGEIPPSLHFQELNPHIDFDGGPFHVQRSLTRWPAETLVRRAAVSSFGMGGTNVHAVLEQAPEHPQQEERGAELLLLSARDETALGVASDRLADHLERYPVGLGEVACTLQRGRRPMDLRRAVVVRDRAEAIRQLRSPFAPMRRQKHLPTVAFLFPGQGAQHLRMGWETYCRFPTFRKNFDIGVRKLRRIAGFDPSEIYFNDSTEAERLHRTDFVQPSLFVLEHALATLWMDWGLDPKLMIGHSLGEYVAACLAGVMSYDDALRLVVARGQAMQSAEPGSMLSVQMTEAEITPYLGSELELAAVNAERRVVVAGPDAAIETLIRQLEREGKSARKLHTSHAFHSRSMEPVLDIFARALDEVELRAPERPFISNLTGEVIKDEEATDPRYWLKHLRQTVRFSAGVGALLRQPIDVLIEVGPGRGLSSLAELHPNFEEQQTLASLGSVKQSGEEAAVLLRALGELWKRGASIEWPAVDRLTERPRCSLPTYPFARKRYWIDPPAADQPRQDAVIPTAAVPAPNAVQADEAELERTIELQLALMQEQLALLASEEIAIQASPTTAPSGAELPSSARSTHV